MEILAYTSTALTPVVAFGVYIMLAKYDHYPLMNNSRVFTSLALMQLLLEPVAFLITALSGLMSALGCFERIRIYLNSEDQDFSVNSEELLCDDSLPYGRSRQTSEQCHGISFQMIDPKKEYIEKEDFCITARVASCGWDKAKEPLLRNLNFRIKRGKLTMIIGPVSCGKTTLLKALIQETPQASGFSRTNFKNAAYCAQDPWLTNGTVKENIMGDSQYDLRWYETVVKVCALETDLAQFALGEHTVIGSKGLALSGGQKMRVVSYHSARERTTRLTGI